MRRILTSIIIVALLFLSATNTQAQTRTRYTDDGWVHVATSSDNSEYYVYNGKLPGRWDDNYIAQWVMVKGTFTRDHHTYYNATQLQLYLVSCRTNQTSIDRLILKDKDDNIIYDNNYSDDLHGDIVVPNSVQERLFDAVCEQAN